MSADDVGSGVGQARGLRAARTQGEVTQLLFHAARHDAAATRADAECAQLGENDLTHVALASHGPRGESPPHAGACGG